MNKNNFSIESNELVDNLFNILEITLEETTEVERQVISAFSFGMISAMALENNVEQHVVHGTMIAILINKFKYSEIQSSQFTQTLINSTDREYYPTMYTIIHRGIEAYYDYKNNNENEIYDNLTYMIDIIINNE